MRMLATEPIVFLVTLYMSFIYGLMYALLGAYPLVFQGVYGMNCFSRTAMSIRAFLSSFAITIESASQASFPLSRLMRLDGDMLG